MWTSKLANKFPKDDIERLHEEHHRELQRLRKLPGNSTCAECGEEGTSWASVNIGVFLCVRCADVHRGIGTHISKVKGCTGTYLWGPDEIARMQELGNLVAVTTYGIAPLPNSNDSKEVRLRLCRQKYEQHCWAQRQISTTNTVVVREPNTLSPAMIRQVPSEKGPVLRKLPEDFDFDDFFADLEVADRATANVEVVDEDPLESFLATCLDAGSAAGKATSPEPVSAW